MTMHQDVILKNEGSMVQTCQNKTVHVATIVKVTVTLLENVFFIIGQIFMKLCMHM